LCRNVARAGSSSIAKRRIAAPEEGGKSKILGRGTNFS
jgi:hypothetical protein